MLALAACGNESATEKFEKAQKYGRAAAVSFYEDRKIDAENYKDITIIQKEESHLLILKLYIKLMVLE